MKNTPSSYRRLGQWTFGAALRVALICGFALVSLRTAYASTDPGHPAVHTQSGLVVGFRAEGMNQFLGIPYAVSPVGALRWMPPQAYGRFSGGILHAAQFGSACTQPGGIGGEDCLFLNVFTPHVASDTGGNCRLPVMVWIHGGGLQSGSSNPYDPNRIVKKGVVVVTINYRLGYLGFFAESAIDAEGHLSGNYGLMDQQLALTWVRKNISGFCGDPDRVTIFGQSAGGQSVYAQIASPLATGLFHRGIAQSGAYAEFQDYYLNIVPLTTAETIGTTSVPSGAAIADSVGCADQTASCLRAVPAATMVANEPFPLYPFVDGTLLPQAIDVAFASGALNHVPVISGTTHNEYRIFVAISFDFVGNPILNATEYDAAVTDLWGSALGPSVLALYPFANYSFGGVALGASGTDGFFSCPVRNADQLLSRFVTTYAYEFNDANAPPPQSTFGGLLTFPLGAYHTGELQYLFKPADFFGLPVGQLSPKQMKLSDAMISYWTQFAKTGNPNSPNEPEWDPYNPITDEFQSLKPPTPLVESSFDAAHRCSLFWSTF